MSSVPDTEKMLADLIRRTAEVDRRLEQLPEEDEPPRDASREDWAANDRGPTFELGPASIPLRLEYLGSDHRATLRDITVLKYGYEGVRGTVYAHCHLRGERRTFLFSRITKAIDPADDSPIPELGPWLDNKYRLSDVGLAEHSIDQHEDALLTLFYVAKADGIFRAPEKAVVQRFLTSNGLSAGTADVVTASMTKWETPSAIAFGKCLGRLAVKPAAYRQQVKLAAEAMVESDKTVHPKETNALKRLRSEVSSD
ncbi:hypothetical protein EA658_13770 [Pseudoxanthomonas winnipegensis]|uniref:Co-chaperone DjlA N-terminal domain-containing protein n=1 Tax=Pseudoxanthomonas winnipegensis TaxID=2480810 RepID=A0ABY1WB53_9GAMM|nr:TerB family tellurite resistance protein [Pseudoxanthomonas winnipegensis]TAA18211.1 hypothetical protein EA658_13770 [Pseudoxanthomonas winnipegensis]